MIKSKIIIILMTFLLLGCGSTKTAYIQNEVSVDESLLQICTYNTPIPKPVQVITPKEYMVYNGASLYTTLVEWQTVYDDCAMSHDALVKAVRSWQQSGKIKIKK